MTGYHEQWAAAGRAVLPGSVAWYRAHVHPWEPVQPISWPPKTPIGRAVSSRLSKLRAERDGSPKRQAARPRQARKRRDGEITVSELARATGFGPRQFRKRLEAAGFLQVETEARETQCGAPVYHRTLRLSRDAVSRGLGRRLETQQGTAYDVITRKGAEVMLAAISGTEEPIKANRRHAKRETIRELRGWGKSQAEIVRLTGFSRQLVSHHLRDLSP